MPKISAPDGVKLHVEEVGSGTPVVFVHEYAGDYRSWEPQVRHFCRQHRCVTYSQRGYPPSDVPSDPARYSQDSARDDVIAVMDSLGIDKAHVVGHSMGAYTALHVGIRYPRRCLSVTAAGCGWGSAPDIGKREAMKALAADTGKMFAEEGIAAAAAKYADAPMRQAFKHKDPRGWAELARMLAEHSAEGHAHAVPRPVIVGDEDDLCLDGSVFLQRTVPRAAPGRHHQQRGAGGGDRGARRAVLRRRSRPLARAQSYLRPQETDMGLKLEGETALVTGGSEGIGKGIARALAKEGVDVAICARRKESLEAAANEIAKETGRKITPITADLRKDADARNFIEQGAKALGRVDIMVNNAGSGAGGVIEHLSEDDWEKGLQLKFMGYVRCLRYVLPIMVKQGGGRVVNLIGNDGVKPSYWEICPGAANAAGQNLTLSLAGQYGKNNVSFVAVNPGPVRTERWAGLVKAMSRDMKISYEEADKLAPASIPMGRIAEVDEVANLVVMLASPLMAMVNGTMIEIDGGQDKPLMDRFRDQPTG